jgi:hypothetical protein
MVEKTEPVAVVAEVEDKFETKLQDIFNRDFGMDQVIDVDQMLAIESGMSPGFLEHSIQKKIQVPTMTESAFHLFGPCRLVSPLNIQPKRVFRDRWVRGQETKTESSLDQELALLASTHEITFSIEQIDSILSCIVSHGAQTLFMTIPSLEKYSSNSTESLIELDHAIGLSDLESEQINKLLSQGCTITKLVESIWKKTIQ